MNDPRLDRILSALDPADAVYVSSRCEPPWQTRRRRLDARDAAIRDLAGFYPGAPYARARSMQLDLEKPSRVHEAAKRSAVDRVLALNDDVPLGLTALRNVLAGARTPDAICLAARKSKPARST